MTYDRLTRGLGFASAALGTAQVLAPGWSGQALGIGDGPRQRTALVAVGIRELAAAAGLLASGRPAWLWARVGGDAIDLALLGRALTGRDERDLRREMAAAAAVVGLTAVDTYAAVMRSGLERRLVVDATAAVTVAQPAQEAYDWWRQLGNLPQFITHLDEVRTTAAGHSHWRASAPFGRTVEWDAEIVDEEPGQRIAWRSVPGAVVDNEGEARFVPAPGGRGTEVYLRMRYDLPGGRAAAAAARYFGQELRQQLDDDLRRFKQIAETGEVVRSEGAPGGKRTRRKFPQHPARPLSAQELREVRS